MEFSVRGMKNLLRGETDKRVARAAAESLGEYLDEWGQEVAEVAVREAEEDGRISVREGDIRTALIQRTE